jgi:cellulose synthase/poly-beta-1,6-N-acetylglucosamine synthase-like glycosyltransferase
MTWILWISLSLLIFIYLGYGLIIWLYNTIKGTTNRLSLYEDELPQVAIVIAAYNEATVIHDKLINTFSLDYPADKLTVYLVCDGSNDNTMHIAKSFRNIQILWQPIRKGKSAAINRAMQYISEPVTVFTDANVMLNKQALRELVSHYADPLTGGVSGEKRVCSTGMTSAAATEGLYWKYESFVKLQEARLNTLAGAAGELFSIRTNLFKPLPSETVLDDFIISMNVIRQGYRIGYEPRAFAMETPSMDIIEESKRKIRIAAGGIQSVVWLWDLCNPFRYGLFAFQYIFHRLARWVLTPLLVLTTFISSALLLSGLFIYKIIFLLQILFHITSLLGWLFERKNLRFRPFFIPFYFNFMHVCVVAGWFRYLKGNQSGAWEKSVRVNIGS